MSDDSSPSDGLHGLDPGELLARGLNTVRPSGGGAAWIPPSVEELAAMLPQYRIERLIGHGGMGAVYRAVQITLDRTVAIKLLPAEVAGDPQFVARFQREARTLARLQHPGIVTVFDFGQTNAGHLYFAMEFVDGTDLHHLLRGPGLNPGQAFELIAQICDALHYAHRQGVIHRDIKPANIFINMQGRAKIGDFGLARPSTGENLDLTSTDMVMGTPDYMAPEQRTGQADHRSDIFALGVMLYEMLTGQTPRGAFDPPSQKVQVDVRIDSVVLKALQSEPARRYQQVSEMQTDVEQIQSTPATGVPKAATRNGRASRWQWGVLATVVIALVAGASVVPWKARRDSASGVAAVSSTPAVASPAVVTPPRSTPAPVMAAITPRPTPNPTPATMSRPIPKGTAAPTPVPPAPARVATATPVPSPAPPIVAAYSSLAQALISTSWTWTTAPPDDRSLTERRFTSQGATSTYRGAVEAGSGRWQIAGARMVRIQDARTGALVFMSFDPAFTKFDELDAQGNVRARGTRKALAPGVRLAAESSTPGVAAPAMASKPRSFDEALLSYKWSWNPSPNSKGLKSGEVLFRKDGIAVPSSGGVWHWWHWNIRMVHLQTAPQETKFDHKLGIKLSFDSDFGSFEGTSADGSFTVKGVRLGRAVP